MPAAFLLLGAAYLLAGYYLVPRLIRWQASEWVRDNLHKSITLGDIRFDPIHFTTDMDDIAIPGPARPMVAVGHLHLGFSPLSVFQSAYRLDELRLDRPFVNAIIRRDGSLNLAELVPPSHPGDGPPAAVRIDTLAVRGGRLAFADHSRALEPRTLLAPISFTLKDFHTAGSEGGEFALDAMSERNERFAWRGAFSMAPLGSRGRFAITNLQSDTVYRFIGEYLPVTLTGGSAAIAGSYAFAYGPAGVRLAASLPRVTLSGIGVGGGKLFPGVVHADGLVAEGGGIRLSGPSWTPQALHVTARRIALQEASLSSPVLGRRRVRLAAGTLADAELDYAARRIDLGTLDLTGLDLPVRRDADGSIDLARLLPAAAKPSAPAAATQAWAVSLGRFALADSAVHVEDRAVAPMARFALSSVAVAATGLGTDLARPVDLSVSARVNGGTRLSAQGMVTPSTGAGALRVALGALPLAAILPYLPSYPMLDVRSGQLGAQGIVRLAGKTRGALRFAGDASLNGFSVYEKGIDAPLASWDRLALAGIRYGPDGVEIARAHLSGASGRIAVTPDRGFNVSALMNQTPPAAVAPVGAEAKADAVPPVAPRAAAPMLPVRLRELTMDGGTVSFADYSITPNFEARIEALHGSIRNIANMPDTIAAIDLQGQVIDRYSPVMVKGTANLFGYDKATDIKLAFRNIELPIFNPYSGVYAGYSIAKGKLTTEFSYHIVNRALQADHHVIIDQLQWGQATANKARVPWPVRLATALLKDKNGVIDLDVPVKGSLDDPTFRLAPIIWKIIGNVIEKAVTAPFRLIGSLFAGAEKGQYVDFVPGSAQLPAGSGESLAALAKGLSERPGLNLDIPAGPGTGADAVAMADSRIDAATMAREAKKGQPADFATLAPDEQHDRLQTLYKLRFHKGPDFAGMAPAGDGKGQRKAAETQWLRAALRKAFAPTDKELEALGAARGAAIRDALLAKGDIDPLRVFLSTSAPLAEKDDRVRFELKLR